MSEPLKISVLDRTDTQDFEQLMVLLKKFTIDTYIRNKAEFSELRGSKKLELVNNAINEFEGKSELSILNNEDIKQLKRDIDSANRRIQNLEHTKMFSEEEIGKATVKVPTTQKDESKKKIQTAEKTLDELQEVK